MEPSELEKKIDILEYMSQFMDFRQKGDEWWALSCFTDEKTPSFSVRPEAGSWWDFSSGQGGDLIAFVRLYEKCSFQKAVSILMDYAHISSDEAPAQNVRLEAASIAKRFRRREEKRSACTAKALPDSYMNMYEFNREKLQLWADEGISFESMARFGVRYDPIDNRIVYPLRNEAGEIFCVSGRTCDPDYKARGIRKYTYTSSIGSQPTIGCFWENRGDILAQREIIICEGIKSVLKLDTWGIRNGGCLYTSHLSRPQFDTLVRLAGWYGVRLVFALDADVDIRKDKQIMALLRYARVEWVKNQDDLLSPKDAPVDRGEKVFRLLYSKRMIL